MRTLKPLESSDLGAIEALFDRGEMGTSEAFVRSMLKLSPSSFLVWADGSDVIGCMLASGTELRTLWAILIHPDYAGETQGLLEAGLRQLQGDEAVMAIVVIPEVEAMYTPLLNALGFESLVRFSRVQELRQEILREPSLPEGYHLTPWADCYQDEVARLMEIANRGTVEGLLLSFPEYLSPDQSAILVRRLRAGHFGTFLSEVSTLAWHHQTLVGSVIMLESAPQEAFLSEIFLAREHQSTGMPRALIRHIQAASFARGYARIRFVSQENNRAVARLFQASEIVDQEREVVCLWVSERYRALRRKTC